MPFERAHHSCGVFWSAAIIAALMLTPAIAEGPDMNSGNFIMPGCKDLMKPPFTNAALSAVCIATIDTLLFLGPTYLGV
jgi:hypothetical protein